MLILFGAIALNVYLLIIVPKGFFPEQDTGRITGVLRGDQSVSFQTMRKKLVEMIAIVRQDPDVENVIGFTGAGSGVGRGISSIRSTSKPWKCRYVERRPPLQDSVTKSTWRSSCATPAGS